MFHTDLIIHGQDSGRSSEVTLGFLAALVLGFFIDALNREGAGPTQEKITLLARLETTE
jgi:hypothetical protein